MYETTTSPRPDLVPPAPAGGGVTTNGLGKRFGDLWALRDLDLDVEPGTVLGLLGHNGAGKTTAIRILTTLSQPTEGSATVAGYDVANHPERVREQIGVASQQSTVDDLMSAHLNLVTIGRLRGMGKAEAATRSDELLEQLDLTDFASALVRTYSGGMRRRLDLAASLMGDPAVLFLDEPTTGLDPVSRNHLWDMLTDLVRAGTTVILTTQYLEEADRMADDIVVLDHGRTVAHGTPAELKLQVGGNRLDVTFAPDTDLAVASTAVGAFVDRRPAVDEEACVLTLPIREGVRSIEVLRALDDAGIDALDVTRREVTLDDVFLTLTGSRPDPDPDTEAVTDEPAPARRGAA
ncbi:MAG: ATP-binding cassette domain-containing protein [Acidimicrobiia bacterium]